MSILTLVALISIAALLAGAATLFSLHWRSRARERLWHEEEEAPHRETQGWLARWLALAGYRRPEAPGVFVAICLACLAGGVAVASLLGQSPVLLGSAAQIAGIPVVGLTLARAVMLLPWIAALFTMALPALLVRAQRDRRVVAIEQDLPMLLELLATLAESGLSFDASLDRVIDSQPTERPLITELRLYALEVRAGGARSESLERLADRIEVRSVTSAVSALVQAEEVGSGLSEVLRPLADDLRLRRRERALARAEALPEKLVFPLVLGFLPGLMVWTLGPSLFQLMNTVDAIMRGPR